MSPAILRYTAFSDTPEGGNPAGVVLDATGLSAERMQTIATGVGFSETAFLARLGGDTFRVRYFAPDAEVDFCGHATVAAGVALAEHEAPGEFAFVTNRGPVSVMATEHAGRFEASFESVPATTRAIAETDLDALLATFGWTRADLDPQYPARIANAGNDHPVLVLASLGQLATLAYDFEPLRLLCMARGWVTIQCVAPDGEAHWRSRNPFPYGGVVEDAATGSAAAAFGAYLRDLALVGSGDAFTIDQGVELDRPSRIRVAVRDATVVVSGTAARLP